MSKLTKEIKLTMSAGELMSVSIALHEHLKVKHGITNEKSVMKVATEAVKSDSDDSLMILACIAACLNIDKALYEEFKGDIENAKTH